VKRLPQLDGVRGIAILLVILHNQRGDFPSLHLDALFEHGWMGVDLFFTLSGFLITGILLDAKGSANYFKNFYARRCLRIWPLYYAVLFVMFAAVPFVRPSQAASIFERSNPWWSYLLYLQNFLVTVPTNSVGPLGVTWSLAIEEQFYMVWPLVVRFCSRAQICAVAGAVICASPFIRLVLLARGVNIYTDVFCRLDGIMWGALLAVAVRSSTFDVGRLVRGAWFALAIGVPLAVLAATLHLNSIVYSMSAFASIVFVYLSLFSSDRWLQRLLTNQFMVYTGTISYGLYLLHKLPFDVAKSLPLDRYAFLTLPLMLAACYVVAAISWTVWEKPFLGLKRFFESRQDEGQRPRQPLIV